MSCAAVALALIINRRSLDSTQSLGWCCSFLHTESTTSLEAICEYATGDKSIPGDLASRRKMVPVGVPSSGSNNIPKQMWLVIRCSENSQALTVESPGISVAWCTVLLSSFNTNLACLF